ncbi:MAG TPA: hypothetical protein VMU04_16750 [Candidatus Acidoferrum sp.]|nr:hypothetical protein [Candidatus Acidoferrum sp.]
MARTLRVQYAGAIYHVMNRGDHLEVIIREEKDAELFLATLAEPCGKIDWQVHAFRLMSNHFLLVLETPHGWCLGSEEFRQEPLLQMTSLPGYECAPLTPLRTSEP